MPVPTKAIPHSKPSLKIIRKPPKKKNHRFSKDCYSEEYIISVHNIFRVQLPKSLNFISYCTSVAPKEKLQNSSLSSSHLIFFSRHPNSLAPQGTSDIWKRYGSEGEEISEEEAEQTSHFFFFVFSVIAFWSRQGSF